MSNGLSAAACTASIVELGFTHVVIIPDSESAALFDSVRAEQSIRVLSPTREGEGIAIAAGLMVGGAKPLLVIQNTGLMEGGDALRGCGIGPKIPLRLMVGWRGYAGAKAGRVPMDSAYPFTEPLLAAWQIPTWPMMGDDDLDHLAAMDQRAQESSLPAAVLTGPSFR